MAKRGAAMEEILTVLKQSWTGEPFHHRGSVYEFPEIAVRPVPSAPIPILIGGGAEAAIRRAARLADGIFSNVAPDKLTQQLHWIEDECDQIGRDPSQLRIIHYSVLLPGTSEEAAWARYVDQVWHMTWKYSDMEESAARPGAPPHAPELTDERRNRLQTRFTVAQRARPTVKQAT